MHPCKWQIQDWNPGQRCGWPVVSLAKPPGALVRQPQEGIRVLGREIWAKVQPSNLLPSWTWPCFLRAAWEPSWDQPPAFPAAGWMPSVYDGADASLMGLPTFAESCMRTMCLRNSASHLSGWRFSPVLALPEVCMLFSVVIVSTDYCYVCYMAPGILWLAVTIPGDSVSLFSF